MKARAAVEQRVGDAVVIRNLVKQPLTVSELRDLAARVGGAEALVAPKRRAEAADLSGEALLSWLAADGGRVRRPILVTERGVALGFAADAQAKLPTLLG